jgi:hypothetical protein
MEDSRMTVTRTGSLKPIGVYTVSNTISVPVYQIDYHEDMVLAGDLPQWCPIVDGDYGLGFMYDEMLILFSDVIKVE